MKNNKEHLMLNKFTVLACYCIYFSKTIFEYAHMFKNVSSTCVSANSDEVSDSAAIALEIMDPDWELKNGKMPKHSNKKDRRKIKQLKVDLKQAESNYKNTEWRNEQLKTAFNKTILEKLRKQIKDSENI